MWGRAEYSQASQLFERALAIFETRMGPDHLDTARSLSNLADVLRDQGDLESTRRLYQRAVTIYEAHLAANDPETEKTRRKLEAVVAALEKQE